MTNIQTLPGILPLALCSGLLGFSRLDRLRGSWMTLSFEGRLWTGLWGIVETDAEPSKEKKIMIETTKWRLAWLELQISGFTLQAFRLCLFYTHCYARVEQNNGRKQGVLWEETWWTLVGCTQWLQPPQARPCWQRQELHKRNMRKREVLNRK